MGTISLLSFVKPNFATSFGVLLSLERSTVKYEFMILYSEVSARGVIMAMQVLITQSLIQCFSLRVQKEEYFRISFGLVLETSVVNLLLCLNMALMSLNWQSVKGSEEYLLESDSLMMESQATLVSSVIFISSLVRPWLAPGCLVFMSQSLSMSTTDLTQLFIVNASNISFNSQSSSRSITTVGTPLEHNTPFSVGPIPDPQCPCFLPSIYDKIINNAIAPPSLSSLLLKLMKRRSTTPKLRIKVEEFQKCPTLLKSYHNFLQGDIELPVSEQTFTLLSDLTEDDGSFEGNKETPEFSRRILPQRSTNPLQMTLENPSSSKVLETIKTQFKHFDNNPSLSKQLRSVNQLLQQIQNKLSLPSKRSWDEDPDNFKKSSPQSTTMGGILYTNFNLTDFVEDTSTSITPMRRRSSLLGLENVDNIEYYKILYLLGENNNEDLDLYSEDRILIDMESPTVKELNMEIEMLNSMLKLKNEKMESVKEEPKSPSFRHYKPPVRSPLSPLTQLSNSLLSRISNRSTLKPSRYI